MGKGLKGILSKPLRRQGGGVSEQQMLKKQTIVSLSLKRFSTFSVVEKNLVQLTPFFVFLVLFFITKKKVVIIYKKVVYL